MTKIRVAGIVPESIVDGPGIRLVVFTQGCVHNCRGCHNPESHSKEGGYLIDIEEIILEIKSNPLLDGITLSGGDPFEQSLNMSILAKKVKDLGLNVVTYTGYILEEILNSSDKSGFKELLEQTDILVDGPFELSKKDLLLNFKGSSNQRIIDVKKTLENNKIIIYEI